MISLELLHCVLESNVKYVLVLSSLMQQRVFEVLIPTVIGVKAMGISKACNTEEVSKFNVITMSISRKPLNMNMA